MLSVRNILFFVFGIGIVAMAPILGWPMIRSSTEVGLLLGVGCIIVVRPYWAWAIILIAATLDESRSVAPAGLHILAAVLGLTAAIVAHQKLLSGHSQTQVAVLVAIAITVSQLTVMIVRAVAVIVRADWLVPHIADTVQYITPSLLWTGAVTFMIWPTIRRRWVPLQRISTWS